MKRIIDITVASVGLVVSAPILVIAALAVRIRLGKPVIYRQLRPGLHGRPFELLKLRTMRNTVGPTGELLGDADRMDPLGNWIRRASIDEIPQLWNVLCGRMSLVGPRPLLMEYLPLYNDRQRRRHDVRPGITGWAQVNGRNALAWPERLELDVWYVENQSLRLDLLILARTIGAVIRRQGISHGDQPTMPRFTGDEEQAPWM